MFFLHQKILWKYYYLEQVAVHHLHEIQYTRRHLYTNLLESYYCQDLLYLYNQDKVEEWKE